MVEGELLGEPSVVLLEVSLAEEPPLAARTPLVAKCGWGRPASIGRLSIGSVHSKV